MTTRRCVIVLLFGFIAGVGCRGTVGAGSQCARLTSRTMNPVYERGFYVDSCGRRMFARCGKRGIARCPPKDPKWISERILMIAVHHKRVHAGQSRAAFERGFPLERIRLGAFDLYPAADSCSAQAFALAHRGRLVRVGYWAGHHGEIYRFDTLSRADDARFRLEVLRYHCRRGLAQGCEWFADFRRQVGGETIRPSAADARWARRRDCR